MEESFTCSVCKTSFEIEHDRDRDVEYCPFCGEDLEEADREEDDEE